MTAPSNPAPLPRASRRRTSVLIAGILLAIAPFLYVNPWKVGEHPLSSMREVAWPWEQFAKAPLAHVFEVCALFTLGLFAILAGLGVGGRRLLDGLVAVGLFYVLRHHGVNDAYRLAATESFGLSGFLVTLALLTGCLLVRSTEEPARSIGRRAIVAGAILAVVLVGATFAKAPPIPDICVADEFVRRLPDRIDLVLGRGGDADAIRKGLGQEVFGKALPEIGYALAVAFALVAALRSRGGGARGRRAALLAVVSLLLVFAIPAGYGLYDALHEYFARAIGTPLQPIVSTVATLSMETGLALLWLVAGAFAARARIPDSPGPAALGPISMPIPPIVRRVGFAFALALCALTLWVGFRKDVGLLGRDPIRALVESLPAWNRSVASLAFVIVGMLVAVVGVVRAREGLGWLGVVLALASAFVLEHALRVMSNGPTMTYYDVTSYVPFALAALAAGSAASRGRGARAIAVAASVMLLLLLLTPRLTFDAKTSIAETGGPYESLLTMGVAASASVRDYLFGFVPEHGCPAVDAWLALLAFATIVLPWMTRGSVVSGRTAVRVIHVLFALALVWPLAQVAASRPPPSRFDDASLPAPTALERAVTLSVFAFTALGLLLAGARRASGPTSGGAALQPASEGART